MVIVKPIQHFPDDIQIFMGELDKALIFKIQNTY